MKRFSFLCLVIRKRNCVEIVEYKQLVVNKIGKTEWRRLRNVLVVLAGLLFFGSVSEGQLLAQTLVGKVFTVESGGDTVPVYMARLQWLHTATGTHTKKDGSYQLPFVGADTLIVSYSFYKADTLIVSRDERHRDFFINTAQALQEVVISKKRQKYVRKGNPAVELVKQVIEHKDDNRIEEADCFRTTKYKKLVLAFGRFDMNFQKNRFNRQFSFLEKYIDTIPSDSVPVLTISLRETLSDRYYRKSPHGDVNFVRARRMQGADEVLENDGLGADLNDIFSEVNIFDNDIDLMVNRFVSPLSSTLATSYYHYYITDTVLIDSLSCIELSFTPVNSRTFGFNGRMYIVNDSTYALKKYSLSVPYDINLNFVRQLIVEQEFTKNDSGLWAPVESQTFAKFSIFKKGRQLYARQTTMWYGYEMGAELPDSVHAVLPVEEVISPDVTKYKSGRWKKLRPVPLTAKESFLDSLATELRRLPLFKALEKTAEIVSTGYIATAKNRKESRFDIRPVYDMVSYNPTEGVRLRVGGMTTAKMHDRWFASGYLAFGCRDLRLKYDIALTHSFVSKKHHFNESPKHAITFSSSYDMEMPGQSYSYVDRDNILMSYDVGSPELTAQYVRRTRLRYQHEWQSRFSVDTWLQYENNEATGALAYWRVNRDGSLTPVTDFNAMEWRLKLRWAPGELSRNRQAGEKSLLNAAKNVPVFSLTHTAGIMDRRFWYNRTDLSVEKRFWLSSFGHIDASVEGGIVWDAVPFPELYFPPASQSLFLTPNTFCLMKPMEFIMDRYVAVYATYYLKGWIFNRIPLWNRLNFREVISFSGIYGGLSAKNIPGPDNPGLYLFPEGCGTMGKVPYMEITAGIENIFQFIRIDYVRRLSYAKDLKGWAKNGIRFTFRFSF